MTERTNLDEMLATKSLREVRDLCGEYEQKARAAKLKIENAIHNPSPQYSVKENEEYISKQRRYLNFVNAVIQKSYRFISDARHKERVENKRNAVDKKSLKVLKQIVREHVSDDVYRTILNEYTAARQEIETKSFGDQ